MELRGQYGFKALFLPGGVLLAAGAVLVQSGLLRNSTSIVDFCYYTAFVTGLLLAWRFHSSRVFSALILLLLAERALRFFSGGQIPTAGPGLTALEAVSFLIPVNFALLSFARERGFSLPTVAPRVLILFLESVFVAVICRPLPAAGSGLFHGALVNRRWSSWTEIPQISLLVLAIVTGILIFRALTQPKPVESGLSWALLGFFLAINSGGVGTDARAYLAVAAIILVVAIVETSYAMAYYDELTGLPSRRAFNQAKAQLAEPYAVAVVDIDHFKSVNDTYGHDIGDEVLCMVAGRLAQVTGGGQAFRVGGEEFTILFPGKPAQEVVADLEMLRTRVEESGFRLRGADRRSNPRGPDRRMTGTRKRKRKSSPSSRTGYLQVTVSIGVAEPTPKSSELDQVIALADQALYRAKQGGRNRVELASDTGPRGRKKAAQGSG